MTIPARNSVPTSQLSDGCCPMFNELVSIAISPVEPIFVLRNIALFLIIGASIKTDRGIFSRMMVVDRTGNWVRESLGCRNKFIKHRTTAIGQLTSEAQRPLSPSRRQVIDRLYS